MDYLSDAKGVMLEYDADMTTKDANGMAAAFAEALRAAFAAGREAMRAELHECVKAEAFRAYDNAKPLEWGRVDAAIRALPDKDGE